MPSPVGHALGGIAAAWALDLVSGRRSHRGVADASLAEPTPGVVTLVCAGLATLPDADLLLGVHRTASHSISAVVLVTIVAALVTGWVTPGTWRRVALMCGAAYASHLLLDWMAVDRNPPSGMQLLWPFSRAWFISGLDLFPPTQRYRIWSAAAMRTNVIACAWETALLLPIVMLLWVTKRHFVTGRSLSTYRSPGPICGQGARRPPSGAAAGTGGISGRRGPRAARSGSRDTRPGR
jgi:membrane-bound metal-dependent hydrolase YbcI (DUF457 family)